MYSTIAFTAFTSLLSLANAEGAPPGFKLLFIGYANASDCSGPPTYNMTYTTGRCFDLPVATTYVLPPSSFPILKELTEADPH